MSDTTVTNEEMPFLMGGRSMLPKQVQLKIGNRNFVDASSLMSAIRTSFSEADCQEVLRQLQASGALTPEEVASAQQKAAAFPSTVTEPAAQRAATIAVGMASQKGSLPAVKMAALASLANRFDAEGRFDLADKIDAVLEDLE